ncbi:MAG: class I SAM-dependent methyltransferase [Candidatus Aenigmarchaeota archaeon]|nr:class I SAM-dependent methyltransferase [Candidatus Aenigmarchaeota archaeon]
MVGSAVSSPTENVALKNGVTTVVDIMTDIYSRDGNQNLKTIENADKFTDWMYSEVKPYLCKNILEVGSGIGTYSEKLARDFKDSKITVSDIDTKYVNNLKTRFRNNKNISCIKLNLENRSDFKNIKHKVDSAIALNVIEHIEDDVGALNKMYALLEKNGRFVVLVPAHKFLYNCLDESLGHHRRYTKEEMIQKVSMTKFKINKIFYFNFISIFGWYLNGNILKKTIINKNKMKFLNALVPGLKFFEKKILRNKIGLSLIVVLEKE